MNRKAVQSLKAKGVNLKAVKSKSLWKQGRGLQRSKKK